MKKQSVWSKVGAIALTVLGGFYGLLGLVSYFIRTWDFGIDTFFLLTGLLIGYYGVKAIKEAFAQGDGREEPLRPVPAAAPKVKVKREEASPSPERRWECWPGSRYWRSPSAEFWWREGERRGERGSAEVTPGASVRPSHPPGEGGAGRSENAPGSDGPLLPIPPFPL